MLALAFWASCQIAAPAGTRLYPGYGGWHREVTTGSAQAQRWFDQGLQLLYGFNHDEAIRSFEEAARLDPDCAMAWWGAATARGIHVNNTQMSEEACARSHEAAQEALRRLDAETPAERALVQAAAARFARPDPSERAAQDRAYATEMESAWLAHPHDPDVGALFAESMMNLQPWDYWTSDGAPKGRCAEIVATLEHALAAESRHPGANHFYIHAVEASAHPDLAAAAADRLRTLVPGSGHLVHMPSHIYINVGRYADAADANEEAIASDEAYFRLAPPPEFYRLYFIHNVHFLAFAAMMEGRYEVALGAALKMEAYVPEEFLRGHPEIADGMMPVSLHVLLRFGRWEEILAEPDYPDFRLASRALRHYARAVALANLRRVAEARAELAAFDAAVAAVPDDWMIGNNSAASVLTVAGALAEGEILWREGRSEDAFARLREAVALEDGLTYDEPPGWTQPTRHALGALLLSGGRAAEAEAVYRTDLDDNPRNAWSLLGLEQALRALDRDAEADALAPEVAAAWLRADVDPPASCYCAVN